MLVDEFGIVGCYHYGRVGAYVVGYFFVFGIVFVDFFFAGFPFAANGIGGARFVEFAGDPETVHAILHAVLLVGTEIAFGVAEVIDGIEQIGFATAIGAGDTGDLSGKIVDGGGIIAKLYQRYFIYSDQRSIGNKKFYKFAQT